MIPPLKKYPKTSDIDFETVNKDFNINAVAGQTYITLYMLHLRKIRSP